MRIPFQTALDFHPSQAEDAYTHGIPIDEFFPEDAANRVGTSDFKLTVQLVAIFKKKVGQNEICM